MEKDNQNRIIRALETIVVEDPRYRNAGSAQKLEIYGKFHWKKDEEMRKMINELFDDTP